MKCSKCGKYKDEAGYLFTDDGSDFETDDFICIACADKIPENVRKKKR